MTFNFCRIEDCFRYHVAEQLLAKAGGGSVEQTEEEGVQKASYRAGVSLAGMSQTGMSRARRLQR